MPPAQVLDGLAVEGAHRRPAGAAHSIAEIVAHLAFWQSWFVSRCNGVAEPMVQTAHAGWPAAPDGTWPDIHQRFLDGLHRAATLAGSAAALARPIAPPIEFPPLTQYTISDALVHIASHNAHHLGQVILLRQLSGFWPPPAGSWTW